VSRRHLGTSSVLLSVARSILLPQAAVEMEEQGGLVSAENWTLPILYFLGIALGSAGIWLIFRRSWLGWPKPANPRGFSIPCGVRLSI